MNTVEAPARPRAAPAALQLRPARARYTRLGLLVALVAALVVGGYYAWRTWVAGGNAAGEYLTAVVQRGDLEDTVTATGTLQPRDFVDVGTQVSGQLKKLHVEVGAVGQGRASSSPRSTRRSTCRSVDADRAQLRNQQAQLADRQAQLVLARAAVHAAAEPDARGRDHRRGAAQRRGGAAPRRVAQIDVAEGADPADRIDAARRRGEPRLHQDLRADVRARWCRRRAKQGQTLNANQQAPIVMRIADLSTMTVQTQVSEADVLAAARRHGRLLHHARQRRAPLVRQAAPDHADARTS